MKSKLDITMLISNSQWTPCCHFFKYVWGGGQGQQAPHCCFLYMWGAKASGPLITTFLNVWGEGQGQRAPCRHFLYVGCGDQQGPVRWQQPETNVIDNEAYWTGHSTNNIIQWTRPDLDDNICRLVYWENMMVRRLVVESKVPPLRDW